MLLFLYVTEEAGRKYVRDMPWPPAAECNMITNKQSAVDAGWLSDVAVVAFTSNSKSESEAVADLECFLVPLENNSGDLVRILEV